MSRTDIARHAADDEDAAAVLAVLAALAGSSAAGAPAATARSVWGHPSGALPAGPDAWWASGLPR